MRDEPSHSLLVETADSSSAANGPSHRHSKPLGCWAYCKCFCFPCIVPLSVLPVLCCCCLRKPLHEKWGKFFEAMVVAARVGGATLAPRIWAMRILTDPPIGVVPLWLPILPDGVGWAEHRQVIDDRPRGEWFFPSSSQGVCCGRANACRGEDEDQLIQTLASRTRVVLYFHGGAFSVCTPRTHRPILMRLVHETGATILATAYRRAPEHPWPTPVDDCLDTYQWMLECGARAERVAFAGDSAGGGLVLAVMAAARARGLPLPAGGIMISPWLDLADPMTSPSWQNNQRYDYVIPSWSREFALAYAGGRDLRQVSPGNVPVDGLGPLLIEVGDCEVLRDQVVAFVDKARAAGADVTLNVSDAMVHVFPLFAFAAPNHLPPNTAFSNMAAFLDRILPPSAQ
jgi:monoterpene epsilon-lactone hydrolase